MFKSVQAWFRKGIFFLKNLFSARQNSNHFTQIFNLDGSASQYGQETFVRQIAPNGKAGYFVDVGARCGRLISNTKALSRLGWKGICIEPHPDLFEELKKNRPDTRNLNIAISDSPGQLEFVKFLEEPMGNSGLLETFRNRKKLESTRHEIIKVQARCLRDVLKEENAPAFIDYLDIDVEGHELNVLKTLDFTSYTFGVIGVEVQSGSKCSEKIEELLACHHYIAVARLGSDLMFMKEKKGPLPKVPG